MKCRSYFFTILTMLSAACACLLFGSAAQAQIIIDPNGDAAITSSSDFSGDFAVANLLDAMVTQADVGTAFAAGGANQWAGSGVGPHVIQMIFDTSITTDGFVYSQRLGDIPTTDKATSISFWFNDTDLGTVVPSTPADAIIDITNTDNSDLTQYSLGGTFTGQFVQAEFTGNGGNPGGSEMRMTLSAIPEPTSLVVLGLGMVGLITCRRRS